MHVNKENFPKVQEWINSIKNPRVIPRLNFMEYEDCYYVGLVFEIKNREDIYTTDELVRIAEAAEYYRDKLSELLQVLKE